jgi:hypothetical protein
MPVDFETMLFLQTQDVFSRTIQVTPVASQPGAAAYTRRGIFNTIDIITQTELGPVVSDQKDIVDILDGEFPIPPEQRDLIFIPADGGLKELGWFEVVSVATNGVGQITLDVREYGAPAP